MLRLSLLASAAVLATSASASAQTTQDAAAAPAPAPATARTSTTDLGRDIIVTGARQSERDVLQGTSVLRGEELTRAVRPTIGDTLAHLPGVSATSFGPNASRPVLRGFQGERIRVLTDGIGSIDVSNTSVDHAVIINPLLAERIEVLRGPAALLYGSSAVGGVVNVIDTRIPRTVPANGYRLNAITTYGSAANERSGEAAGDVALGRHFVFHADGSYVKTDDLKIGGYALTPARRAEALASAKLPVDPDNPIDFAANAAVRGTLPNSASRTWTAGAGLALITDGGSLGVSYSHYDALYGVPIRYATLPGEGQEAPRLDVVQNRFDVRAELNTGGGFLQSIRLRAGHADYRHFELAQDGSIGTAFYNNGTEARLELVQATHSGWSGTSGGQVFNRLFDVQGNEAFLPRNETNQVGLFTLQQLAVGPVRAEAGVRFEHTDVASRAGAADLRFFGGERHFDAVSGSAGASYGLSEAVRVGIEGSHTERAPSGEELFANGAHAGTEAYELGNPDFRLEKSWGLEATLHAHGPGYSFDASAYANWFSNYLEETHVGPAVCVAAAAPSGRTVDLPCFQTIQRDARYYGIEANGSLTLAQFGAYRLNVDLLGDYVRATIVDLGPVPRIPAARVLGGLEAQGDKLNARVEAEHVFAQNRIAAFETPTDGYTVVNASLGFNPFGQAKATSILVSADNVFDVDARRAASFLKDFAPLPGRDIRVTLKLNL